MPPVINMDKCSGCGTCEDSCPIDVIHFNQEEGSPVIKYHNECWHCGSCRQECPEQAIKIVFSPRMLVCGAGAEVYF